MTGAGACHLTGVVKSNDKFRAASSGKRSSSRDPEPPFGHVRAGRPPAHPEGGFSLSDGAPRRRAAPGSQFDKGASRPASTGWAEQGLTPVFAARSFGPGSIRVRSEVRRKPACRFLAPMPLQRRSALLQELRPATSLETLFPTLRFGRATPWSMLQRAARASIRDGGLGANVSRLKLDTPSCRILIATT